MPKHGGGGSSGKNKQKKHMSDDDTFSSSSREDEKRKGKKRKHSPSSSEDELSSSGSGSSRSMKKLIAKVMGELNILDGKKRKQKKKEKEVDQGIVKFLKGELKGEAIQRQGLVVEYFQQVRGKKAVNFGCQVEAFATIIGHLDVARCDCVREMGFGGLLSLQLSTMPRQLCYWLMTRIDGVSNTLRFGDGRELPLCPPQWNCIFGLPCGGEDVPTAVEDGDLVIAEAIQLLGVGGQSQSLSLDKAANAVLMLEGGVNWKDLEPGTVLGRLDSAAKERRFRLAFMVVVLGFILCPTTDSANLAQSLLPAVAVADRASTYNWSSYCHEWLMTCAQGFRKNFMEDGLVAGSGGCTLFVVLFYLDHISRPPIRWGSYPRVSVWQPSELQKVVAADKTSRGDYGVFRSVDVAYGEKHPLVGRDVAVDSVEDLFVHRVSDKVVRKLTPLLEGVMKRAHDEEDSRNPEEDEDEYHDDGEGKKKKKKKSVDGRMPGHGGRHDEEGVSGGGEMGGQPNASGVENVPKDQGPVAGAEKAADKQVAHIGQDKTVRVLRSGKEVLTAASTAASTASSLISDQDDHQMLVSHLLGFIRSCAGSRRTRSGQSEESDRGPILLECYGNGATAKACYEVLSFRQKVSTEYVMAAAALYNATWRHEYGSSSRVMVDPFFAIEAIKQDADLAAGARKFTHALRGVEMKEILKVFVPVNHQDHWWCAAFDFSSETIFKLDTEKAYYDQVKTCDILKEALDHGLRDGGTGSTSDVVNVGKWNGFTDILIDMKSGRDNHSCGVVMLFAIRHFTSHDLNGAPLKIQEPIEDVRRNMVVDDVLSAFNAVRPNLPKLVM